MSSSTLDAFTSDDMYGDPLDTRQGRSYPHQTQRAGPVGRVRFVQSTIGRSALGTTSLRRGAQTYKSYLKEDSASNGKSRDDRWQ